MYAKVASRSDYSVKPAPLPNIHSEPPYLVARSRHTWFPEAAAGASPCGSSGVAGASPCGSTGAAGAASVGSKSTKGLVKTPSNNVLVKTIFLAKKTYCVQNPWNPMPQVSATLLPLRRRPMLQWSHPSHTHTTRPSYSRGIFICFSVVLTSGSGFHLRVREHDVCPLILQRTVMLYPSQLLTSCS